MWEGAAAICLNEQEEVLMVLQEDDHGYKRWSVPSGGKETTETYEACCIREVAEETGYQVRVEAEVRQHETVMYGTDVHIRYYHVELIGGEKSFQDPDDEIHDIRWHPVSELARLDFQFEDEREILNLHIHSVLR
ncbi:NUDIX hydrolase [Halobacillus salinus]|uniref:NUDIX hydrolase n=1 Tax=Halobacillus salinus TaxID=192814 RepID=A0A4Z0GZB5_9BACI|nr:NUDIX hydrolase [Halobacillus salinus]TGB03528.1 NUDIX hydrolase [Halobacillus salinus]